MDGDRKQEYFCSYSGRLTSFLKAFGLSYIDKQKNPVTGASFCVFNRTQKLIDVVDYWSTCRNLFKDYDEDGNKITSKEAGDS